MSFIKVKIKGTRQVKQHINAMQDKINKAVVAEVTAAGELIKAIAQENLQRGANSPYSGPTSFTDSYSEPTFEANCFNGGRQATCKTCRATVRTISAPL